jgi:hypothetical protein
MRQAEYLLDRTGRQRRLAAAFLGDHTDPSRTLHREQCPPPPYRVRVDLAPTGDLRVRKTVSAINNALAWTTTRCGRLIDRAIRTSSSRCAGEPQRQEQRAVA